MSSRIVEVVGLAGSGKTTLARSLRSALGGVPEYRVSRATSTGVALRHLPGLTALLLGPRGGPAAARLWLHFLTMTGELSRWKRRSRGVLILDQGPVYAQAFHAREREQGHRPGWLAPHYEAGLDRVGPHLDAVVHLDADDDTLHARVCGRASDHPLKGAPREQVDAFFRSFRRAYADGLRSLRERHRTPVLAIDTGSHDPEQTLDRARGGLASIFAARGQAVDAGARTP